MNKFSVSVIIPAHNAAATIAETLKSLQDQTSSDWEAIVINDGSTDETGTIVSQFLQDSRIRISNQSQQGASAARNAGIDLAQFDWLLFLDADDWIAPNYLEQMTAAINIDTNLDGVCCGWVQIAPTGTELFKSKAPTTDNLFIASTFHCPFAVHACIVRRAVVISVGAFDTSLQACEDWDLWQRIARTNACFGAVDEIMAFYRMRPSSLSRKGLHFFQGAMRVLKQGHHADPRVPNPNPLYLNGQPIEQLPQKILYFASWLAGFFLSQGEDTQCLLQAIAAEPIGGLDSFEIASCLFQGTPALTCQAPENWVQILPTIGSQLQDFLVALEARIQMAGLARQVQSRLERLIVNHAEVTAPLAIGTTYAIKIEVTDPIETIFAAVDTERLYSVVELEGNRLGTIELPICNGQVDCNVIIDAIAAQFFWAILGRFFEHTRYCQADHSEDQLSPQEFHDRHGWTAFLQELWNRPDWTDSQFYDPELREENSFQLQVTESWLVLELSSELPNIETLQPQLQVIATVGGTALGVVTIPVEQNLITAQELRYRITLESGIELCRACVREGLIGNSITDPTPLRQRLAAAYQSRQSSLATNQQSTDFYVSRSFPEHSLVLSRHFGSIASSASRRAILPSDAAPLLLECQSIAAGAIVPTDAEVKQIIYAPDLIPRSVTQAIATSAPSDNSLANSAFNARNHFETLFATQPDPWKYTSPYEQVKYEQTLALLPKKRFQRALELACAEGHFTTQLAPYVEQLIAADISQIAIDRAAQRCTELKNVRFLQLDLSQDPLPDCFPLIVCSEVLYYLEDWQVLQAFAHKVADALEPGGYFLHAHANLVVDEPDRPGFSWDHPFGAKGISDAFSQIKTLHLVNEIRTPLYRVQLFQKSRRISFLPQPAPQSLEIPQPTPPPQSAAHTVLWQGGQPWRSHSTIVTRRLPILMYHRVAAKGSAKLKQWRVTPQAFAEQLSYLRDAGYYSVSLDLWYRAILTNQPLPGRAILMTFDDGYVDFLEAWSLLKQYGFSATVFLVANQVGQLNHWDQAYAEKQPLLDWEQIKQLQAEGVEFGSHSLSHRPLTALSAAEVVKEGWQSRSILEQQLGRSVHAFAYPYGDVDPVIQHLIGACGYTFGLSCRAGFSEFRDNLMALPRIEIAGSDTLQSFIAKLASS